MKQKLLIIISCFFLFYFFLQPQAYSQVIYSNPENIDLLGDKIEYLIDSNNVLTLDEVTTSSSFKPSMVKVPNLGIMPNASVWVRFTLKNTTNIKKLILQLDKPMTDEVSLYLYDSTLNKYKVIKMGEFQVFDLRKYLTPDYLFDIKAETGKSQTCFLKIRSNENVQIPLFIGSTTAFFNYIAIRNIVSGTYIGIMIVMLLYNLFIFFSIKERTYLLYALYITFTLLTQTNLQGYPFQFLWPNMPWIAIRSTFILPALVGLSALEFFKEFLRTKERTPKIHFISRLLIIPYCISMTLSLSGYYSIGYQIVEINAGLVSVFMLIASIIIYNMGNREARFFLVGWSVFLIGICIYILKDFHVLPYNNFTRYTMHFGSGIEVILLSFALADKINILKKEKEASQAEVLVALKENEKLITEQNVILEQKVEERTLELNHTNKELNTTVKNLKDTQAQLVDAEKMASLGQLTAGIAHEINNPINFVSANIKPLQLDIEDLLSLIKKYEALNTASTTNIEEQIADIDKFKKQIDFEYLLKEIPMLIDGIGDGAKRTAEIVKGLRNFSRLDEGDIKEANINEGIESTLTILRSAIPENISIVKKLTETPLIECYPGKLNQVFMNAINNAVHAMKKNTALNQHTLTISTYESGQSICVSFEDTGIGMTPEVKARIFEPFFTTKNVGEGTGLGMSIVFKIIETHGGKIDIETEINRGTKIIFTLPKKIVIS